MQKDSGKKRKRLSGAERRRQIAEAAHGLFARRGFRGTTTREIARAAGVSEGTIFKHFAGKKDLYAAVIDRCLNDPDGSFVLTRRLEGKEGVDVFRELALFIIERYSKDPSFSRILMFSALEGRQMSDMVLASRGVETLDFLAAEVKRLIKAGEFGPRDPHLAARAFIGMVSHYCMLQEIYGYKRFFSRPQAEVVDAFVGIFVDGMAGGRKKGGRRP